MKKVFIILVLLFVPFFSCFAGDFYSNIVVVSTESEKIMPVLLQLGITAYYIIKDKVGVIFEQRIDEQDIEYGITLTTELSRRLNTMVIYTTNHDSDVLVMYVYKNGQGLFAYNSAPDYFEGGEAPPSIINIDRLLLGFPKTDKKVLMDILNSYETFAEDLHTRIIEKLMLPEYSVGYGYNVFDYMSENETEEMETKYNMKIEKMGG